MTPDPAPPMLRPTLMAGLVAGLVTSVPLLGGLLLLACCSPVIGCGFLAAWWYGRDCRAAGVEFTPALGRTVGLIAGAFWAAAVTAYVVLTWPGIDRMVEDMEKAWDALGQATPEMLDSLIWFQEFYEQTSGVMLVFMVFCLYLLIGAVFSTLGGMIAGAVFGSRRPSG